ncbi:VanZ family protein [Streptomyces meridianus]|uniref:VanZ family protein n=1 Tax=Streptomyces meridianus TaxID=2938945 RepID=A0ABT0X5T9_9ACTN|nr:VanZ family protein [Streptomyces meridianus]MCM2577891.1 VanZ family protein [Streptomyces meridianus]
MQHPGRGDRAAHRIRATGLVLLCAHLLFVGWVTLRPLAVPWVTPTNLQPLATIRTELAAGPWEAAEGLAGSLLLLAPLGPLLPMVKRQLTGSWTASFLRTTGAGLLVSVAIALLQTDVPGRTFDVDRLLLNATGVAVGHLLLVPPLRARLRRRHRGMRPPYGRPDPQGGTPNISRVRIAP